MDNQNQGKIIAQYLDNDPMNNTPDDSDFPTLESKPIIYNRPVSKPSTTNNNHPSNNNSSLFVAPIPASKTNNGSPPFRENNSTSSRATRSSSPSGRRSLSDLISSLSGDNRRGTNTQNQGGLAANNNLQGSIYRVIVEANNISQQEKVRSIYPEAVPRLHNNRSVMQIGVFSTQENADVVLQTLKNNGFNGVLLRL